MTPLGIPPRTMPNLNTFRILSLVWKRRAISRIEVAAELGLTKSTVTKITGQLLADGLVVEQPVGKTEGRGRPRVALQMNHTRGLVLGLEIRTDGWSSVLVRFDGTVARRAGETRAWDPRTLGADLEALVRSLAQDPPDGIPVMGVGLALPGIVDAQRGVLVRSNPLDVHRPLALKAWLEEALELPVTVENDAKCGCWGELAFSSAPVPGPFVFLLCEDRRHRTDDSDSGRVAAVGFGLVLGGKTWWGPDHSAGEFSSVLKESTDGRSFQFSLPDSQMVQVFDNPDHEDALVLELGRNLAMLVNFLNLKAVYVSWPASGRGEAARGQFERLIRANWLYSTPVDCVVAGPTGGADAVSWGAAGYFLEDLWGESSFEEAQPRWK
jgi:hypothetical protein